MTNWRGGLYYVARGLLGPREWRRHFREVIRSDIEQLSAQYLERLLQHACRNVPHYRSLGLSGRPLDEYPVLTKAIIRSHPERFRSADLADRNWSRIQTSGSTGETLEFSRDRGAEAWNAATDAWYLSELLSTSQRAHAGSVKVAVWHRRQHATKPFSVWSRLARVASPTLWLDPFEALSEEGLLAYARTINRARPSYIWAFAGILYEIARTARDRGLRLHTPKFIICSGETLHPFMRSVIEEAFACRAYDLYGSTEAGHVAGECSAGNLHIFAFSSCVEILDPSGRTTPAGEEGRIVLTGLHNYAMPFIRYDTEDVAVVGPRDCPCGCQLPTISRIGGRTVEFFVTETGQLVSGGRIAYLMRPLSWIVGFQVLQRDVDDIAVSFVRAAEASVSQADVARVERELTTMLGAGCRVHWEEVKEIPHTRNGKRPYARSLVWEERQPISFWECS